MVLVCTSGTLRTIFVSIFHVWWRFGGSEMTSSGGEVTCGGEMVGGESSWWRDGLKP